MGGRVIASVPESSVMDVYNSVSSITDSGVPAYLKSLVNAGDADAAYSAFLAFKDVVKKNQVASAGAAASAPSGDAICAAAKKLSDASYPFLKEVDWSSDLFMKPLPGASSARVLQAVDKAIVMGSAMDGNLLKAAAEAHHKAIGSIDAKGVTSAADYEAVNAALGRAVASVPTSKVMDVYNAFASVTNPASEQVVFDSECNRCKCGSEGVLRVQGCGEGCAAVNRSRSSSELLTLGHGRTVRNYSKLSSGMHFPVHSQMGTNSCHSTSAHAQYLFFSILKAPWS